MRVGEIISHFKIERIESIPSLKAELIELEHTELGFKYLHLLCDDENNAFAIAFPTTPTDSTGVAHILEHCALTSSEKYPVRDPFFSMMKRSVQTFMNAFTSSDWTMYPFATLNRQDFYNLLDVYLQAVFFPKLERINFLQEGHRLEFEGDELTIKGVVYNEMKGAMSGGIRQLGERITEVIFPTNTYHFNSGGDPLEIPKLTYENFVDFHKRHYHPSNAYIYSYGNFDLKGHLDFLQKNYLSKFKKESPPPRSGEEKRVGHPIKKEFSYALDKSEDDGAKNLVQIAWPIGPVTKSELFFSIDILESILLENSASPLHKALLESGLGKGLTENSGYTASQRDTFFSVGLQGVKSEDISRVEELVMSELKKIVKEGIAKERIEAAIHQLEMEHLEIGGGQFPFGLSILFRFFDSWMHGGDPFKMLDVAPLLRSIREKMLKTDYLEHLLEDYLIQNPNRAVIVLKPDHELSARENEELKALLQTERKRLTEEQKNQIIADTKALSLHQEKEEDLEILPKIRVTDLKKEAKIYSGTPLVKKGDGYEITHYSAATNTISYLNFFFNLDHLTKSERDLLPLFGELFSELSTENSSYEEMLSKISLYTGGISSSPSHRNIYHEGKTREYFEIESKALPRNLEKLFELLKELFLVSRFDESERGLTLINQKYSALQNRITGRGHQVASLIAGASLSKSAAISNRNSGTVMMGTLDQFIKNGANNLKDLYALYKKIFNRREVEVLLISPESERDELVMRAEKLLASLPTFKSNLFDVSFKEQVINEAWTITTPVNYVAKVFKAPNIIHADAPKLLVLANLLRNSFLHREIREKGGAYGAMANYNPGDGLFSLVSYRDPNLAATLKVYDSILPWLKKSELTEKELHEAIIMIFAELDTPLSPSGECQRHYLRVKSGITDENRQSYRDAIRESSLAEITRVAQEHLTQNYSVAAITSKEKVEADGVALTVKPLF